MRVLPDDAMAGETAAGGNGRWALEQREREREDALERQADLLLSLFPGDPQYPAHPESRFFRQATRFQVFDSDPVLEIVVEPRPCPPSDEVAFLASVSPLTPRERLLVRAWILGLTQQDMTACPGARECLSQQVVSRDLRTGLIKCYDAAAIGFTAFSRRYVYRRPPRRTLPIRIALCPGCGETFWHRLGVRGYCSSGCWEGARWRHERGRSAKEDR